MVAFRRRHAGRRHQRVPAARPPPAVVRRGSSARTARSLPDRRRADADPNSQTRHHPPTITRSATRQCTWHTRPPPHAVPGRSGRGGRQFSMEVRGVLEALAIAFSAQTLVALLGLYISYSLTALRKYHHTAKLAVRAACVTWLSEVCARQSDDGMAQLRSSVRLSHCESPSRVVALQAAHARLLLALRAARLPRRARAARDGAGARRDLGRDDGAALPRARQGARDRALKSSSNNQRTGPSFSTSRTRHRFVGLGWLVDSRVAVGERRRGRGVVGVAPRCAPALPAAPSLASVGARAVVLLGIRAAPSTMRRIGKRGRGGGGALQRARARQRGAASDVRCVRALLLRFDSPRAALLRPFVCRAAAVRPLFRASRRRRPLGGVLRGVDDSAAQGLGPGPRQDRVLHELVRYRGEERGRERAVRSFVRSLVRSFVRSFVLLPALPAAQCEVRAARPVRRVTPSSLVRGGGTARPARPACVSATGVGERSAVVGGR